MTKEQIFRLHLINGSNFAPIIADAIVVISKNFFQNDNSGICNGQILYLAISDEEGPGKSILDSKHVEVILTLDTPEDMDVHEKFGFSAYRQCMMLRITQEARNQHVFNNQRSCKTFKMQLQHYKKGLKEFPRKETLCSPEKSGQRYWSFFLVSFFNHISENQVLGRTNISGIKE